MAAKLFAKRLFYPGFNLGVRSRRKIAKYFLREPESRTLDVGSGNGYFGSTACRRAGGGSVLSVSFDAEQIARCNAFKPHMRCPADKLEFRVMNAENMNQLTEQFDQILLLEVIEHLDDDLSVVSKLAERLKPGGIMHISTPDCRLGWWVGTLDRHGRGGHARLGYTAERVERLAIGAGLDIAYQTQMGGLGMFLTRPQNAIASFFGKGNFGEAIAFLLVYPFYLLVEWMPVPMSWRMFHYFIARRRAGTDVITKSER